MPSHIATRFSAAAGRYEQAANIQKEAASQFDAWLAQLGLAAPASIVEIGCGTGFFTRLLHARYPGASLRATDLAPAMVAQCQAGFAPAPGLQFSVCDGREASFDPAPDWIVSTMCFQWFDPLPPVLARHFAGSRVLAFSVLLDGSFAQWRAAHERLHLPAGLHPCPDYDALLASIQDLHPGRLHARKISLTEQHANGRSFAHSLRAIGADQPRPGHRPAALRPVLRQLEQGIAANYEIGFFCLEK
ncbi:methyltransferase domain-containing protein [Janthinobacterium sp. 17J80-10]|uniref:methyltransferase domain-containing protein n=1 Tax=Janthinobacterium sp. 17J80-10 TaxID=2497863 RepID=UPI0013E89AE2|nr:methyltransferase domain-containing protein [Janthinobacterium sp. 17J80-10]